MMLLNDDKDDNDKRCNQATKNKIGFFFFWIVFEC